MIRAARAAEIGLALERAHLEGLGVALLTLTLRHKDGDALAGNLDVLMQAWRKVTSWRRWKKLSKKLGIVGFIRATEVTVGANGWHPHSHLAMLSERPLTAAEQAEFLSEVSDMWLTAVDSLGGRMPSKERGVDLQPGDGEDAEEEVGKYVTKVQEHVGKERRSIARELARGDLKAGRGGSAMPFELLDDETGSKRVRELWCEYVEGTRGRRAFSWSRGLRARLIADVEDLDDDEILARAERGELVGMIDGPDWDRCFRDSPELMHETLRAVEEAE